MYDKELACHILEQLLESSKKIVGRFKNVQSVDNFTNTPAGMEKFDSICMLLIVIGESLKNLDKVTNNELLPKYSEIDWKKAKGLRDIISHQYFDINAEAIFDVCETKLPELQRVVKTMLEELKKAN